MVGEEDKGVCGVSLGYCCLKGEICEFATVNGYCSKTACTKVNNLGLIVTNADHIRAMSDEELAKFLCKLIPPEACSLRCPANAQCYHEHTGLAYWLQQPYEEDEA